MEYRSLNNLNEQIVRNIHQIPGNIDLVVGIPRSGLLAANLIALHLNLPVTDLQSFASKMPIKGGNRIKHLIKPFEEYNNILVVDDSLFTGKAMNEARLFLKSHVQNINITFLAVFIVKEAVGLVDLYFDICSFPRVFEWNLMHHDFLELCLMDIDGVLCVDPRDDENDDGIEYAKFINNARTLFRPSVPIGALITSRLEKYRKETEEWLSRNKIIYRSLIMLDLPDMETRKRLGVHAQFKAFYYKKSNALLFIESSEWQARKIVEISKRPVFCTDINKMLLSPR